jgi:glycosyltransferase involved in cell wall biosynthesis
VSAPNTFTIGVSIPFFTRLDYLQQALGSLIAQTDHDWTAVVIDDASPEPGADEIVADLGDPRIRYVRNDENLGLARNFDKCLTEPATDIVAVLHADDMLEPGYVASIRRLHAAAPEAALVAPMARAIDAEGKRVDLLVDKVKRRSWPGGQQHAASGDAALARLMHAFFVYSPAISYRPALLPDKWFDDRWRQVMDVDLYARVLLQGGTIMLDRTPVYRYRRHDGTTTSQNERTFTRLAEETKLCREVAEQARALGWRRTAFACRLRWSIRLNGAVALVGSLRHHATGRRAALRDLFSVR